VAILAEIVGPDGRVTAVEYDEALAARARTNLGDWPQVEVVHGDGRNHDPGEVDVVIVFAGSTHLHRCGSTALRRAGSC
jgi:protein-L-isoaspartate(D-aspartate) O-methyltransferase